MRKYIYQLILTFTLLASTSYIHGFSEAYESKTVGTITIKVENLSQGSSFNQERVISQLKTKTGDPFSQLTFDQDLKNLSKEYEDVSPELKIQDNHVLITLKVWKKPMLRSISWVGNENFSTKKLQKKLGIHAHEIFNKETFNKAFNEIKEFYVKKGFFESQLEYKIIPYKETNEIDIEISIHEGHSGYIKRIVFNGLNKHEESKILDLMTTTKHNFFTSWLTGTGNYHEEALQHDHLVIVNYLQNQGYANAAVNIKFRETSEGKLEILIDAEKGHLYHFGSITIEGNSLLSENQIERIMTIKDGATFSIEKLQDTIENIKTLYGKDGYIETSVNYSLHPSSNSYVYDLKLDIKESEQFKIGLIQILGNTATNKNVILRESLLVPGEVFDLRKLKITQYRLQAIGYFKSVNVYPVKTSEDQSLGSNYRDVIIEVEESTTGNVSLFFGFSTIDDLFGGIDLGENNFNHTGIFSWWREGLSAFRGGGEYAKLHAQIGQKQQTYTLTWVDPYFNDSKWRFGTEVNYSRSWLQSNNYRVDAIGGSLFGSYPLTRYWTYGWSLKARDSTIYIRGIEQSEAQQLKDNDGLVAAIKNSISYNSIDNDFKPHRGFRSSLSTECAHVNRRDNFRSVFPFLKFEYINTYYYPVWRKGTLKLRGDLQFVFPFAGGDFNLLPMNERLFLGGETTVRGYKPFILGPHLSQTDGSQTSTPEGGASSALASIEYNQTIFKMLDLFTFFDSGSVSNKTFDIDTLRMSWGFGARIEIGQRLPVMLGMAFPINPQPRAVLHNNEIIMDKNADVQKFFIAMGGQF